MIIYAGCTFYNPPAPRQRADKAGPPDTRTAAAAEKSGCDRRTDSRSSRKKTVAAAVWVKKPRIFYVLSAVGSGFRGLFCRFYLARISLRMKQI